MDTFNEYNRIRRNLMQSARRHDIKIKKIPTAREIKLSGKPINKQYEKLNKEYARVVNLIANKTSKKNKSKKQVAKPKTPASKAPDMYLYDGDYIPHQESIVKTQKSKLYKEKGSEFIAISLEGRVVDKFTGQDLGSALDADSEYLGGYLESKYWSDIENTIVPPKSYDPTPISESVMFFSFIQQRIDLAFNDYLNRSNGGRKGASLDGIHQIQSALNSMKAEDIAKAVERYNAYSDEIKNYLDDALYYTSIQDDHYRALEIIMDLMLSPVEAASAKEIIANHSEELIYAEPGEEIEQMSESIYG